MNLFYTPDITGSAWQLDEEESKHLIRVLRAEKGDEVFLTNGKGTFYKATIKEGHPKKCIVEVVETIHEFGKRNYHIHIAIAPTKNNDRFEWFLEKATEIGIDEITPLICDHSERREVKTERLYKVIVAALKQSVKAYLPELHAARTFNDFIGDATSAQKFICSTGSPKDHLLKNRYTKEKNVVILVGPEGDFSKEELVLAVENGYGLVSLGESRLRTETAGIIVCHTISIMNH
jgi:16S rRNA (uracil1498-N3)-methyltransferase